MKPQDFLLDEERENKDFWHENKDLVFSNLVKGKTVLDVGCGDGSLLFDLYKKGKIIYGVEFYDHYFKSAKKRLNGKVKVLLNIDATKEEIPGKYDTLLLSGVIEHIKDDLNFMRKLYCNVNKNGELILLTSAYPWLYSIYDKNIDHYRRYSKRQIINVLEMSGFKIESVKYWDALGIPFLIYCKLFNKVPISSKKMSNPFFNNLMNLWFRLVENKMLFPFGLDLIVVAKK